MFKEIDIALLKRTTKLLTKIRQDYGYEPYILAKKIFTAVAICEEFENRMCVKCKEYYLRKWITFEEVLIRIEEGYEWEQTTITDNHKQHMTSWLVSANSIGYDDYVFFGVVSETIKKKTLQDVYREGLTYWKNKENNLEKGLYV